MGSERLDKMVEESRKRMKYYVAEFKDADGRQHKHVKKEWTDDDGKRHITQTLNTFGCPTCAK